MTTADSGHTRPAETEWRLGPFVVSPSRNRIGRNGVETVIEPKVMRVLEVLIDNAGSVVSRRTIEGAVWPNAAIGDKTLTRAISELRRALDDAAEAPTVIETIPRKGYRLMAMPTAVAAGGKTGRARRLWPALAAIGLVVAVVIWSRSESRKGAIEPWRQLTAAPGLELSPNVSPNGDLVAYARTVPGDNTTSLFLAPVGGGSELRLTDDSEDQINPVWSPDGSTIAYLSYGAERCEIRSVPVLGGESSRIARCSLHPRRPNFAPSLDWSPDGGTIAFVDRPPGQTRRCVVLLSLDSGKRRLLNLDEARACQDEVDPVFSPDGRRLAATRREDFGSADLYVVDLQSFAVQRLTTDYRSVLGATWLSPDELLFSSDRSGTYRLWRQRLNSNTPRWVAANGLNIKRPRVNARGTLVYESWLYDMNIWTSEDGGEVTKLAASTVWDFHPSLSPDGENVAFVSNRSGNFELWLKPVAGVARQLTRSDNRVAGYPSWAPDGSAVAYVFQAEDRLGIAAVGTDGTEHFRLTGSSDFVAPSWSDDASAIVYGSRQSGSWQIARFDIDSETITALTKEGGYHGQLGTDGTLYYTKPGVDGIWTSRAGQPPVRLISNLDPRHWADWQLIDGQLIFPDRKSGHTVVADAKTGETLRSIDTPGRNSANARSRQWSRDLSRVVWAQLDRTESDLFLTQLP